MTTTYACKRGCCSVVAVSHGARKAMSITLNGKTTTAGEIAGRLGITNRGLFGRIWRGGCLLKKRQYQRKPAYRCAEPLICSDSGRLAAKFNRLPRHA